MDTSRRDSTPPVDLDAPTLVRSEAGGGSSDRRMRRGAGSTVHRVADPARAPSSPQPVDASPRSLTDGGFTQRYRLGRMLGEGGMGEVHLCTDRSIGREVALKVIRAGHGSRSDVRIRFEREARIQGQLEHPSVVPVYDLGVLREGEAFFTMKRIHGLTLEEIIEGLQEGDDAVCKAYTRRKLLAAFGGVCLAIAFAHARGVVHRDLKPANVILGEFGEVYVLDWGVARIAGVVEQAPTLEGSSTLDELVRGAVTPSDTDSGATKDGTILGTPGYMAPEQLRGDLSAVDEHADIYSLGAILFELLTLQPLHPRDRVDAMVASTLTGADAHVSPHLSEGEDAPELDAICVRATATDPLDRYASARELHDSIERYLDGDRDLEKRRELATLHVQQAEAAIVESEADPGMRGDKRARAIRELNAALAIDPRHPNAVSTMIRLLVELGDDLPPEAEAELEARRAQELRRGSRVAAVAFLSCLLLDPLVVWHGVRNLTPLLVMAGFFLAVAGYAYWLSRQPKTPRWSIYVFTTLSAAVASSTMSLFGAFVLVPGVVVACMIPIIMNARANRKQRVFVIVMSALALLVPLGLQHIGWLPETLSFHDGVMHIHPWTLHFAAPLTVVFLIASALLVMIIPVLVIGRSIDTLVAAERRLVAHAWNFRQLVPDEARGAASASLMKEPGDGCVL